jgi:hypothetical protein
MKLDLTRWREALRRFEGELKQLKKQRLQHREPGTSYDSGPPLLCIAEVTRLYCLRRHLKGKLHAVGSLRQVRLNDAGTPYALAHVVSDLASQEALLRSIEGWLESFLVEEVPAVTTTTG